MLLSDGLQLDEGNIVKVAVVVTSSFQSQGKELLMCFVLVIRIVSRSRIVSRVAQINVVWTKASIRGIVSLLDNNKDTSRNNFIKHLSHSYFTSSSPFLKLCVFDKMKIQLSWVNKLCKLIMFPTRFYYFTQGW